MLGDTHSETGGPARLPAQVAVRWGHINWNSVRRGKKYFVYWADQSSQGRIKSLVPSIRAQRTNQGRADPYLYTSNPHSSRFQTASRGNPSLVSLDMLAMQYLSHAHCTLTWALHSTVRTRNTRTLLRRKDTLLRKIGGRGRFPLLWRIIIKNELGVRNCFLFYKESV